MDKALYQGCIKVGVMRLIESKDKWEEPSECQQFPSQQENNYSWYKPEGSNGIVGLSTKDKASNDLEFWKEG